MIGLQTFFWFMVLFFGLIGFMRGWTKEIIATSGLVLSLFAVNQFGTVLVGLFSGTPDDPTLLADPYRPLRQQFYILATIHLVITFFSYQGPTLAGTLSGGRLAARLRQGLQERLLGLVVGGINGYLIYGTIWSFLEYRQIGAGVYERLAPNVPYGFDPAVLLRPEFDAAATLIERLPLPLLAPYLPFLIVIVFLFVIVVMI
jgi:uncharacterized membrane protein required for colicin V production